MTEVAAAIWNSISETQDLQTEAAAIAFNLDPEQLIVMEDYWWKLEKEAGTPQKIAGSLITCVPPIAEKHAIQSYVSENPELQMAFPDIVSAQEAAYLMKMEWRLSDEEATTLETLLQSPEALGRWAKAAKWAQSKTPSQLN
jgi:hypothetical protein